MTEPLDCDSDRARSEDLLAQAARTSNMAERGRLIDEAAWWRFRADDVNPTLALSDLLEEPDVNP